MDKNILLEELFELDSNTNNKKFVTVREKMVDYLKTHDEILISNAICFIDAVLGYLNKSDDEGAYKICQPIFIRLVDKKRWDFYDICLIAPFCSGADNYEEAYLLTREALYHLENFKDEPGYKKLRWVVCTNLCIRLVKAKYLDKHYDKQHEEIELLFSHYIETSFAYCKDFEDKRLDARAFIYKGIFYGDANFIDRGMKIFKYLKDETSYELYNKEVEKYLAYKHGEARNRREQIYLIK